MYIVRICAVYLILLFDSSEFRYGCKHNFAAFAVWADSTTDYHIDWITMNYHLYGARAPVDTETPTPVSELRNVGETSNNILTTRINVYTSRDTISTGISSVSATQTSIPFSVSTIKNAKYFTDELFGCKTKWTRACGIKKKNEKHTLKSSETVMTVISNTGISRQEVGEKSEIDLPPTQTTEMTLHRSDIYTQSNPSYGSDTTTTTKSQDSDAMSKPSIQTLQAGAENTADTTISTSQTRHNLLNADISYFTGPNYSTTSDSSTAARETASTVANAQTSSKISLAKKKKASLTKKKAQKCLPNVAQLKMIIRLENTTAFYPGISEDRPFHRGDHIIILDPAFRDVQTFFFLKLDESNGDTYANSLDNSDEFQNIQCMVDGLTPDIVYTGWHRWQYSASTGTSQLICEANTIPSRYDTDYVADIPTTHPLWYEPEQSVPGFEYLLSVQPSASGLYICIAVDANYNVLLTSYLDIRVKTVVRSKNASITPQSVQIYTNDTQASFLFNHCRGKITPQTTEPVLAATTVFFYSLDESYAANATFAVSYLHTLPWRRAGFFFENLNLSSPMILQCKIAVSSDSDMSKSTLELYFRHESAKNRTYRAFTAIVNETLNFSCKQSFARVPTQANASYFEGNCSDRNPFYINSEGSNITLTVNKQMCLICSSHSSQIKLQINTEDNYRTKLKVTNRANEKGNCSAILDMPTKFATVNESSYCEEFAVTLSKEEHENQNRTISFQPYTYKVFYTSRQFIVCQNQPVAWSIIGKHKKTLTSNDDDTYVLKVVAGVLSAIIALLAFFVCMKLSKGKQQPQEELLDSVHMHGSLAERLSYEKADASDELDFANPREHIEPSRISIGPLIGSGKFGKVYKAYVKCKSLSSTDSALKVAVKELKAHFENNARNIGTVNKEIRIMRMMTPHFNVINYYGYSLREESNLLIMEMAEGPSLLEYLREQRIRVPGFALRLNYQSDYPDIKHALVGHKISISSSYSAVTYSHELFESRSNIEYPKDNCTNSVRSLCNDNAILETVDNQQRKSQKFRNDDSLSSMPDYDQWSSDYEDSNNERIVAQHMQQCCSERSRRNSSAIESMSKEIFSICRQVARGMAHISSLNIIHRDLAARNVVIASSAHPLIVKICDFGMAHNLAEGEIIYKEGRVGPRPFRWMSPEALNKGEFSVLSDIWSYGVVCWEVITLGSYPFGKMPNFAAAAKVAAGHNLPRPSNCEPEIYAILKSCWRTKPSERASFESLEVKWSDILEANSDYIELRDIELCDCE